MTMKSLGVPVEYPVDEMAGALVGDLIEKGVSRKELARDVKDLQGDARKSIESFFHGVSMTAVA